MKIIYHHRKEIEIIKRELFSIQTNGIFGLIGKHISLFLTEA